MLPKYHILFGLIFVAILYLIFPSISVLGLIIIFLSSVLIDVDHVLYYSFKKRNLNPIKAYKWYMERLKEFKKLSREQRRNFHPGFYLFHGVEWLILLFFLGTYLPFLFFIFLGFSFHLLLDIIYEFYDIHTTYKMSLILNRCKYKKL